MCFCHQLMSGANVNAICNSFPVGTGLHKVAHSNAATLPVASTGPIRSLARCPPTSAPYARSHSVNQVLR